MEWCFQVVVELDFGRRRIRVVEFGFRSQYGCLGFLGFWKVVDLWFVFVQFFFWFVLGQFYLCIGFGLQLVIEDVCVYECWIKVNRFKKLKILKGIKNYKGEYF